MLGGCDGRARSRRACMLHRGAAGPKLSPKVHGLLLQEMNSVPAANQETMVALVGGEDAVVAE